MLHLLIALCSHPHLVRLRADALPSVEQSLRGLLAGARAREAWRGEGALIAACGPEPGPAADLALRALADLRSRRDSLFGFALVLAELPGDPGDEEARRLVVDALALVPDEQLWVAPSAAGTFDGVLETRRQGGYARVLGPAAGWVSARSGAAASPAAGGRPPTAVAAPWTRSSLVERCLELLSRRLNDGRDRTMLYLHGPLGAGRTTLLAESARRLGCTGPASPLRAFPLFRRRTPLHPFLNSIDAGFLPEVPALLAGHERRAWEDLAGIPVGILRPATAFAAPDRIGTDFFLAYRLYARAWARRAARSLVPAIIACEDVESWHPAAREAAAGLIDDLLCEPSVIAVVTSTLEALPSEFAGFEAAALHVQPFGRREIRAYARSLFPGLELPEAAVRRIRGRSGGLPAQVMALLRYLESTGRVRAEGSSFTWVQDPAAALELPADPHAVAWHLVRCSLAGQALRLLHAIYLSAGLLDRQDLLDFLAATGVDRREADRSIADLVSAGFATEEGCLAPRTPGVRRRLEELLGEEASRQSRRFADHLVGLWQRGSYHREVLLFSFLARAGRTADALRVLPGIVRRKIDERDLAGARAFCDLSRLDFAHAPDAAERAALGVVSAAGRLRAALLEGRLEEAGGLVRELARVGRGEVGPVLAAEAGLAAARYYLAVGDSASALDALKRGLAAAQDAGEQGATAVREGSLLLGATMAADGRLGEAVEYAGLAERESQEAGDRLGALRAGSLAAACTFLDGRLTRAGEEAGAARALASAMGQREDELFLEFLGARIRFLLGDYEGCSVALQRCRCLAQLYRMAAAEPVLDAWIARSMVYAGSAGEGAARLERLEPTREVLLFRAEAAYFDADTARATLAAERGMSEPSESSFPPPHGGSWRDGFLALEGRCFSLARSDTCLRRQLGALHGHLAARRGSAAEAVRELGELVHGVRPDDNDPNLPLYLFLYADALPEESGDDDKVTVLAKALKGLQERASRIDAPAERSAFLRANRWHQAILQEARSRRLA